jgi:hypothetical protein
MKLLAFTDIHGSNHLIDEVAKKFKSKKINLGICSGDLTIFGDGLNKVLTKLNRIKIPILVIPGNHEEIVDLRKACAKYKNIIYLHKGVYEINGYAFFGFGTGGFSKRDKEFEKISRKVERKVKGKKIILITHQPPYKNKLDYLDFFDHVGNKSFKDFIVRNKPVLSVSGHLHENFGKMDKLGKTILINPGPLGRVIEV